MQEQIHAGDGSAASGQLDLGRAGRIVRRHLWAVIVTTAVTAAAAAMLASVLDEGYVATTQVLLSTAAAPGASSDSWRLADERVDSVAHLVKTPIVATDVLEDLGLGWTTDEVIDRLSAHTVEGTVIVQIEARHPDPATAANLADSASRQLREVVAQAIDDRISVRQIGPSGPPVRAARSRALAAGLGTIVGPFLGAGVALLLHRLRNRVQDVDDIPANLYPIGRLPLRTGPSGDKAGLVFHLVLLRLHAVTDKLSVITVAKAGAGPAGSGSGYPTSSLVAAELARAHERSGRRAVIVQGNPGEPRRPTGSTPGLKDWQSKGGAADALQRMGDLTVLPWGDLVAHPREPAVHLPDLVAELVEDGMVVIIDAPPALDGVGASLMAGISDAIVLVAEAGRTSRKALRASAEALAGSPRRIGVVIAERNGSMTFGVPS